MAGNAWTGAINGESYLANNKLSTSIRHAAQPLMKARQFVTLEDGRLYHTGETMYISRISNASTGGNTSGVSETVRTPEDKYVISQSPVALKEYCNSFPWTEKLANLSQFDINDNTSVVIRDDMAKTLNIVCMAAFTGNQLKYTPTGTDSEPEATWATGGTVATAATRNIQIWDVKQIVDTMIETYIIPKYDGENYMCLAPTFSMRQLFDDDEYNKALLYGNPELLFAGEVNRYYKTRFVEDDHAISSTLGTSAYKGTSVFFGRDAVAEVICKPEELRRKLSVDYGRDLGVGWFFTGGWDEVYPVATAGFTKIVHVTST